MLRNILKRTKCFTCNPSVVCIPGSAQTSAESICDARLPGDVACACPGYLGAFPHDCKWVPAMGTCKQGRHQTRKQATNQSINHANNLIFAKNIMSAQPVSFFFCVDPRVQAETGWKKWVNKKNEISYPDGEDESAGDWGWSPMRMEKSVPCLRVFLLSDSGRRKTRATNLSSRLAGMPRSPVRSFLE